MEEEKTTTQLDQEKPETEVEEVSVDGAAEPFQAEEENGPPAPTVRERRGRWIMAGLAAVTITTLVAVLVVGIFQLTSRWLTSCPRDRTANGPAFTLWMEMVSDKSAPRTLGVPEQLLQTTKFKTPAAVNPASGEGKKENR